MNDLSMQRSVRIVSLLLALIPGLVMAVTVTDDSGKTITLGKPAKRVVTLAPSLTEMVFAAGAGDALVATVEYSDYPAAAKKVPRIGNYESISLERLLAYKPDLILAWPSANNAGQLQKLHKLAIPVYQSDARVPQDIARNLRNIGRLTGHRQSARLAAENFEHRLQTLRRQNQHRAPLTAFYQVWHQPVYSISGQHMIGHIMSLCGLRNIFNEAPILAPKVTREAVLARDPQMIIAGGIANTRPEWLDQWRDWPSLTAVQAGNLFWLDADLMHRPSPRILKGAEILCRQAQQARENLAKLTEKNEASDH